MGLVCCLAALLLIVGCIGCRGGTGPGLEFSTWRLLSCAGEPGVGVFTGLGNLALSVCGAFSPDTGGVFGTAGSGDIGLGGVCPGGVGVF